MSKTLILTVGGSHQPILRSIEQIRPDKVYFLCSADSAGAKGSHVQINGQGKVLRSSANLEKADLPNIITLSALAPEQYEIRQIQYFDNLNECYLTALTLVEEVHSRAPESRVIVDYTGGTKSMSAGLAAAALDDGRCEIQLVTGARQDLKQVTNQTEFVRPIQVWEAQVERRLRTASALISRFDYSGAARLIEEAASRFASEPTLLKVQRWLTYCRAFDAWDRFDHQKASELLKTCPREMSEHKKFLGVMLGADGHGFEPIEDLLFNAERRATQERYDDAVGRLYRALEMTAQKWLELEHSIDTGKVDPSNVPESVREQVKRCSDNGRVAKIGLSLAWEVIAAFDDDPVGKVFQPRQSTLKSFLEVRNQSLFAHGTRPIQKSDYDKHAPLLIRFLREVVDIALNSLGKKPLASALQLPTAW
jgi:hypothetical protein